MGGTGACRTASLTLEWWEKPCSGVGMLGWGVEMTIAPWEEKFSLNQCHLQIAVGGGGAHQQQVGLASHILLR